MLGANDGIVSTASLIVGIASTQSDKPQVLIAGVAALVAGAMAMAAGEYVSVSSQADTESADLAKERAELADSPDHELHELAGIYAARGLDLTLAVEVARQLMAHDAIGAHARDELGIAGDGRANPGQASLASAASFAAGAALPLATVWAAPAHLIVVAVFAMSLVFLTLLGVVSALAGGAPVIRASLRVVAWGALALAVTAGVGRMFGAAVA